jgi:putative ABC transport system permease protein
MKQLIEEPPIYRVAIQSKGNNDAEILAQLKDMIPDQKDLIILSRYEKAEEMRGYLVTTRVLGIGLSVILFIIGVMNFVNTIYVSVTVRSKELAVLESVGMRKKQVRSMLAYEGLIYAVITLLCTGAIGTGLFHVSFQLLKATASYAKYTYPISSMVSISIITLFICTIIPLIAYKATECQSIVQRLRSTQG